MSIRRRWRGRTNNIACVDRQFSTDSVGGLEQDAQEVFVDAPMAGDLHIGNITQYVGTVQIKVSRTNWTVETKAKAGIAC